MANVVITTQPADKKVTAGAITEKLDVVATAGEATIAYEWGVATKADMSDRQVVADQTTHELTIPVNLTPGVYYYNCILDPSDAGTIATTRTVKVAVYPALPTYITGQYVHKCFAVFPEAYERYQAQKVLCDITIPDTTDVLYTAQLELFMSVL